MARLARRSPARLAAVAAALAALAAAVPALRAQGEAPSRLEPGVPLEAELGVGASRTYSVDLAAGHFVSLSVAQLGIDAAVRLLRPDRSEAVAVDAFDDPFRVESVVVRADADGVHTLLVAAVPTTGVGGRIRVTLDAVRPLGEGDDVRLEAERLFREGMTERLRGEAGAWRASLPLFDAAIERFRQLGDRAGEMKATLEKGRTINSLDGPPAAAIVQQAADMAREVGDEAVLARALAVLGAIARGVGDYPTALARLEESAEIGRRIGNEHSVARNLIEMATVQQRLGEPERSIALLDEARALVRRAGDTRLEAGILNNVGIAYRLLGDLDRAAAVYEEALANRRAAKDLYGSYPPLANLGNVHGLRGDHQRALELQVEALEAARRIGGRDDEAAALHNLGNTLDRTGDYDRALAHHQQALGLRRKAQNMRGEAASLEAVGHVLITLGRFDEAEAALQEALALNRRMQMRFGERDVLQEIAVLEQRRSDLSAALEHVRAAAEIDETLRAQITSPELRASFRAASRSLYGLMIDLLQQRHALEPDRGYDRLALQTSERARARVLLDSVIEARVDLRQYIDPALLDRERGLQRQISEASAQLSSALATAQPGGKAEAAAGRVNRLTAEYQDLQAQIRRRSPRYASATAHDLLTAEQIQRDVLDAGTVLLEFALGDERSWLWAATADAVVSAALPPRREIEAATRELHESATARIRRRGETAAAHARRVESADALLSAQRSAVARMLLGPVLERLDGDWSGRRLAIVATGALEYLPFAALTKATGVPLAADHEIAHIPSASVLAAIRRDTANRTPARRSLAVFADPVFETSDPRVASAARAAPPAASPQSRPPELPVMRMMERNAITRLPFSRGEATSILAMVPADSAMRATDFDASRVTVLDDALADYRVVHFATHGVFDAASPAWSGLVLSLVDRSGRPQDGFLRLNDIYNMRLSADLVVLSACQTALGREIRGEGLVGLSRAFMYAGAPRVVASLWQVSDVATAELMTRFYRGIFKEGLRPAAALRSAQLEMSRHPRWNAPFYWAGFLLQGDWR